nr:ELMO domain-containing protein 3-like isoform X2 [Halyomorpha halys]
MDSITLPPQKTKLSELLRWVRSPVKLNENLAHEVDLIFSLTRCVPNWDDDVQFRILQTIYSRLTCTKDDCPQRGPHWQQIGFQGTDPATDLRAVGLYGLIHLLHLTSSEVLPLGHKLYSVSNSEDQPFPLAVLSLNVTNIVLNVFNTGKLNRECNVRESVIETLNSFYAAVTAYILNVWITQNKTIKDSGYLLKDAERYCGRNVKRVLKDLAQNLTKYQV